MSDPKPALWTRNFVLISAMNFQLVLIFYLLVIVMVGYAIHELGASTAQGGLVSGIFIVGTLIGRLFIGPFIQRFGAKNTLMSGLIGFLLCSLLYFLPLDLKSVFAVRFFHGLSMGVASTVLGTLIAQIIPPQRRGEGIGYFSMSTTLATAIGPFLAIYAMQYVGYAEIFMLSSLIALSAIAVAGFIRPPQRIGSPSSRTAAPKANGSRYIEKKALPISTVILCCSMAYVGVLSFLSFYAKEIHLVETALFFFLVYAVTILISRPITGPLMDRRGENMIMYPAFICMAVGLLLLSQANSSVLLLSSAALLGLGYGNIQSVCQTIAIKQVSIERAGYATSTFFIFLDAGLGFGPYLIGLALDSISYSSLYVYSAVFTLGCLVLYYLLHGRMTTHG